MINKIKSILGSVRFWQVLVAFVAMYLGDAGFISTELATTIATFLGVSVTIGTVDKFSR